MRIAFVVGGFPKLSETWILSQITSLIDRGHDIDIYARTNPGESGVHHDVISYRLLERTQYFDVPSGRIARLARAGRAMMELAKVAPRSILAALNIARYPSLFDVLNNLIFLVPFARGPYDTVLCHFGGNGRDLIIVKDAFPSTRFVTMFHGDDYFLADERGHGLMAVLRDLGDLFFVTTDCFGRATLVRQGFDPARIETLRLSIATSRIEYRSRKAPVGPVEILSVGRLVEKKGFDVALRAIAILRELCPDTAIRYTVIGEGPLRAQLTALAAALEVEGLVDLPGAMDGASVMRRMAGADLYLLPSNMEQAGYVLLEAQASGMPVVATRVGGVPEMVIEGESAVLVEPGDAENMAGAIATLINAPEVWGTMGLAGRRHVESGFDVGVVAPRLERALCRAG